MASVFAGRSTAQETAKTAKAEVKKLHAKIGQLQRDFLAKRPVDEPRATTADDRAGAPAAVDRAPVRTGLDQPIRVLPPPSREHPLNLELMRRIDVQFLDTPLQRLLALAPVEMEPSKAPGRWRAISSVRATWLAASASGG
nr:hypothetical protein [Geminicoccus harenae]